MGKVGHQGRPRGVQRVRGLRGYEGVQRLKGLRGRERPKGLVRLRESGKFLKLWGPKFPKEAKDSP